MVLLESAPGLVKIINTKKLELAVSLEINDAKWIRVGDQVSILDENKNQFQKGKVVRISRDLDVETQSIGVFVSLTK